MLDNRQEIWAHEPEQIWLQRRRRLTEQAITKRDNARAQKQENKAQKFQARVDEYSGFNKFQKDFPDGKGLREALCQASIPRRFGP